MAFRALSLALLACTYCHCQNGDQLTTSLSVFIEPDIGYVGINSVLEVTVIANSSTSTRSSTSSASKWTMVSMSLHNNITYTDQVQDISFMTTNDSIVGTISINGGSYIANDTLLLKSSITFNDSNFEQTINVSTVYHTAVTINHSYMRTFSIITYLSYPLLLSALFATCVEFNFQEIKALPAWIFGTLLIQSVLVPVAVIIVASMTKITAVSKLGLVTASFSPGSLLVLPFGYFMRVNATLLVSLVLASMTSAFVSMPLWSLQFAKDKNSHSEISLAPEEVPYVALFIQLSLAVLVCACAWIARHKDIRFISSVSHINFYISIASLVYWIIAEIYAGAELLPSIHAPSVISGTVPNLITALIALIASLSSMEHRDKWKACCIFILIKTDGIAYYFVENALDAGYKSRAAVSIYFFCFISFVLALVVLITTQIISLLHRKGMLGAPSQIDTSPSGDESEHERPYVAYDRFVNEDRQQEEAARPSIRVGAFGSPNLYIWM